MHRFAERDADIFNGVVLVDVQIAFCGDVEIESAVPRDEIQHVIEEADAGGNLGFAAAIEIEAKSDIGFAGGAMDGGGAAHAPCLDRSWQG